MHYYLARYVGGGASPFDPFRPDGADDVAEWHAIDLRPDSGGTAGRALLATVAPLPDVAAARRIYLGDQRDEASATLKTLVQQRLGITLDASTLRGIVRELLIVHARTDGTRWRPLQAGVDRRYRIHLGDLADEFPVIAGGATITDAFTRADSSSSIGGSWSAPTSGTWGIASNEAYCVTANDDNRVVIGTLSGTDVEVSAKIASGRKSQEYWGLMGRCDSTAAAFYLLQVHRAEDGQNTLYKRSGGSYTQLGSALSLTVNAGDTELLKCNGSTIEYFHNGVSQASRTDTSITTGNYAGIRYGEAGAATGALRWDDFSASDIGGGTSTLSVSGSITPAGALTKQANKAVTGSVTPSASLVKAVSKALTASVTPTGAIAKQANKALAGSVTPSGALAAIKTALLSLAGAITPSGALTKLVGKSTSGSITPTGSLAKAITKAIAGTLAPAGALAKAVAKAIAATIAPAGSLATEEIVEAPAVTVTYRDSGHTGTYKDDGHTGTYRSSGHTGTYRESRR